MARKRYRSWTPDQSFLFPPSPKDWLSDDHLVYFVLELVEVLDLGAIECAIQGKDPRGERPYNPAMMVALLVYGYSTGVYSSRKLARAIDEQVAFRVLTGGQRPHFTRVSAFRRNHLEALRGLFQQVLRLCMESGLVKLGHIALDGTKIQANASKHKANSYEHMKKLEERLETEIGDLLARAEDSDAADDARLGTGVDEVDLPQELRRREGRLAKLRQAKKALEEEARKARAARLRELAEGCDERADGAAEPKRQKLNRTLATKRRVEAEALFEHDDDDDEPPFQTPTGLPKNRPRTKTDGTPHDKAQRNFTDPDSRIMMSNGAFLQGYNCQAAVDDAAQIIVAEDVTNQSPDAGNLVPMMKQVVGNLGRAPDAATADAGYWASGVDEACAELGVDVYVSTAAAPDGPLPEGASPHARMTHKTHTKQGRAIYRRRKYTVEPVFGQAKEARGFRRFHLRGLAKVTGEWSLVCTAHNVLKLFRSGAVLATA
ncbi:MAG: IS1182 family transposase [Proteobacteria bacterium]|nr:IS1182 family transposase [Pseudomonadota bacterium]